MLSISLTSTSQSKIQVTPEHNFLFNIYLCVWATLTPPYDVVLLPKAHPPSSLANPLVCLEMVEKPSYSTLLLILSMIEN